MSFFDELVLFVGETFFFLFFGLTKKRGYNIILTSQKKEREFMDTGDGSTNSGGRSMRCDSDTAVPPRQCSRFLIA